MDTLFNTVGILGMTLVLAAYFLQQSGYIVAHGPHYLGMNLVGSVAMIISLLYFWNLASFLLNCAWALISVYGLIKPRGRTA